MARMIGAPPGYVGYDEGGQLDRAGAPPALFGGAVRRNRKGASGRLQHAAADPGRRPAHRRPGPHGELQEHGDRDDLERGIGRDPRQWDRSDSRCTRRTGPTTRSRASACWTLCASTFRPEFLNRVDDIIVFNSLSTRASRADHRHPACSGWRVCSKERGIHLEVTQSAKDVLMAEGYDPAYGARPMRRAIQRLIQDPLALQAAQRRLLTGRHGGGGRRRSNQHGLAFTKLVPELATK